MISYTNVSAFSNTRSFLASCFEFFKWLMTKPNEFAATVVVDNSKQLTEIHRRAHFGVNRTRYIAQKCMPDVSFSEEEVRKVVQDCPECQSIDPAAIQWEKGALSVHETWKRLAVDVTHYGRDRYLTMVDCGPSRFAIWRRIRKSLRKKFARF
jgi:hypothetical protein